VTYVDSEVPNLVKFESEEHCSVPITILNDVHPDFTSQQAEILGITASKNSEEDIKAIN
jgi:hypothetical protein